MREWNGIMSLPDQQINDNDSWDNEYQEELDDYNQMKEDESMEEKDQHGH